jgi:hypothetical protein
MTDANDVGTPSREEGLSPEVQSQMQKSRGRMDEVSENLELEQEGNEALGEDLPGDIAGEGLEGTTDTEDREAAARVAAEQPHE